MVIMTHTYQIRIKGHLDPSWAEWFDGFSLTRKPDGTTLLTGSVIDQPSLHGLLTRIHSLGLPLLLVEQIEMENDLEK
jgi:hypothetical protein